MQLDGKKLVNELDKLIESLQVQSDMDFNGGFTSEHVGKLRAYTYMKSCVERGEFDIKLWE